MAGTKAAPPSLSSGQNAHHHGAFHV
ncbi:Os12g0475800 [Oryza sativa Japonica Group]|uniref:Os12g0475800 protein n=1 Tax=Oryza sativa subsp. japonica TaxID=39947 RepID=C7J9H0_ORYSJ|nr:Os12g0475800 [Oryza sativa Japonica Group]|eukprot:NP_001176948.1 Os12g0475800 [Oryza sativa Japonica Group]